VPETSYQLYCSRNFPPLSRTLKMLGEAGYRTVEGYGALYSGLGDLGPLKDDLDSNGLRMTSGHFSLQMVQESPDRVIDIARTLGVEAVFVPYLMPDARPSDGAGWTAFGRTLAEAGKPIRDAGLDYGWHNHDFEMADLGGGARPLDLILAADEGLSLELDVAWAVRGGQDPLVWIDRYGPRITAAHVKDIAPADTATAEDGWSDVGHGTMDWPALHAALVRAGCTRFVLEHDNPADDVRFARRSLAFMESLA
jgi:sugar phosphate isomerase/epimerase